MRQRILSAWGYQTGPFAALCTFHFLKIFHIFHIHTGEANSYYPRGPILGKWNSPNSKTGWDTGLWVLGASILDHFEPLELKYFFKIFHLHTGRPILITPEGQYWESRVLQAPKNLRQQRISPRLIRAQILPKVYRIQTVQTSYKYLLEVV